MFIVWNICIGQLADLPGCAPFQVLHSSSLATYETLGKGLDFIATIENISVINILLILNPKHNRYQEEN